MVAYKEGLELKEKGFLTSSCCPAFVKYIENTPPGHVKAVRNTHNCVKTFTFQPQFRCHSRDFLGNIVNFLSVFCRVRDGDGNFTGKSLIHDRGVKQQLPRQFRIPLESPNIPFPAVHQPPATYPPSHPHSRLQADYAPTISHLPVASPSVVQARHPSEHSTTSRSVHFLLAQ